MKTRFLPTCLSLLLVACSSQPSPSESNWQEITGRDEAPEMSQIVRQSIYRARIPSDWTRIDPAANESIADTKKPLCEYVIQDGSDKVRITIHNFPADTLEDRVPPRAQVMRWQRQIQNVDPQGLMIAPYAHGGFVGWHFEGQGSLEGRDVLVLGWAMQMAPEHFRTLQNGASDDEVRLMQQLRADYTLKAIGPTAVVEKHREAIAAFARSFELIQEIPHSR